MNWLVSFGATPKRETFRRKRGEAMLKSSKAFLISLLVGGLILAPSAMLAQNATATITGTVSDRGGALIPDAAVTVVDTLTSIQHKTRTSQSGAYTVTLLPIGVYEVSAEKQGFKIAKQGNVKLSIADVARVDLTLDVGAQSETVTVSAANVAINTETAEAGTTISDTLVADLPLNGREFQSLLLLDGTAYETQGNAVAGFRGAENLPDGGVLGFGGSRSTSTAFLVDGLNNRDTGWGTPILIPSIDALQEMKTQTKTYSAEYGGSANQVQMHFKSGTNSLHGTAYEFVRNNDFDAKGFNETSVPRLDQNQFGYSLGGPVIIPKIYHGRNRTFFFANYEGLRVKTASAPQYMWVPTSDQWAGKVNHEIIDPYTQKPFPEIETGVWQVPADRISTFAKAYQPFVLAPNITSASGNRVESISAPTTANQQNYKIDQNIGAKNSVFFRYSKSDVTNTLAGANGTGDSSENFALGDSTAYQISYNRIFTDHLVNQMTYGHVYGDFNTTAPLITSAQLQTFGIQGGYPDQPTPEMPQASFSGASGGLASFGTEANWPQIDFSYYWNGADYLTYNRGNHTISAGFSDLNWAHSYGKGANLGEWGFSGEYSGDAFADFLLGNPGGITINVPTPLAPTAASAVFVFPQYTWATYVQDQWKASRRLTVNAGLRYEFYRIAREEQNRYDWFNFNEPGGGECTANQAAAQDVDGNTGLLQYCGAQQNPSPKKSFAPRLGIAYLPFKNRETTVVRIGYGIFFDTNDEADTVNASGNYPFKGGQGLLGTAKTNILSTTQQIAPITTLRPLQASDLGFVLFAAAKVKRPYGQQWSLGIETSPLKNTSVEVGYEASTTTDENTRYDLNQPLQYDPNNPTPISARRPYPAFGDVFIQDFGVSSNYNAGVVKVRHTTHSLVLMAAYTFSKSLDVRSATYGASSGEVSGWAGPEDARNFRKDYGPSDFDLKSRLIVSLVHNLPIGRGEKFLSTINRPADAILGGWQVNGIVTLQSGFPFCVAAVDVNGLTGVFGERANIVGNPHPSGFKKSAAEWFDTKAFAQPTPGFVGNSGRNILRAPGSENVDLSLVKNLKLYEHAKFQFRAESFNAFNHTNLGYPDFGIGDGTAFGTISGAAAGRIIQLGGKIVF